MGERSFPCTMEGLAAATEFLSAELEALDCPMRDATKFMIAFDEMGSNVLHYSGAPEFSLSVSRQPPEIAVELSDAGVAYNPLEKKDPDVSLGAEERAVGGLGIFMTKKLMDKLEYRWQDGRNVVVLRRETEK